MKKSINQRAIEDLIEVIEMRRQSLEMYKDNPDLLKHTQKSLEVVEYLLTLCEEKETQK